MPAPFSAYSLYNPLLVAQVKARAVKANNVKETLQWLSHTLLVMDPDLIQTPGEDFEYYFNHLHMLVLTMARSPFNPFRLPTTN